MLKLICAIAYIVTGGSLFSSYFREHKLLVMLAGSIALISSFYLFRKIHGDLFSVKNITAEIVENITAEINEKKTSSQISNTKTIDKDFTKISTTGMTFTGNITSVSDYIEPNGGAQGGSQVFMVTLLDTKGNNIKTRFYPYHITFKSYKKIIDLDMYKNMSNIEWGYFKTKAVYSNLTVGRLIELKVVCGNDQLCYSDTINILQ
jgi:hypothetical protein